MKFLFASDSFKGSLSSEQTIALLTKAAKSVFADCECAGVPVADGGEGTTEAVVAARGGRLVPVQVRGPLGETVTARYGVLSAAEAILEMAEASGLTLVPKDKRNPLLTSTYGTGELLKAALDKGYRNVSVAIGGSVTNDGGTGFASALGVRFYDAEGKLLEGKGESLEKIARIDASGIDPRVKEANITVMCDVTNPLCGPDGATYTFGRQKGATEELQKILEEGIETNKHNFTRFLVLADPWQAEELSVPSKSNKASIVFSLPHSEGSLSQVLSIFSFYKINLTKIQSLPIIGREWEYMFYIDVMYEDYTRYRQSIDAVRPLTKQLKILGEYQEGKSTIEQ